MIRRLSAALAVTLLLLLAALPAAAQIEYTAPAGGTFSGGTITSPILAPAADNCASVPYSFTGDTNTGICSAGAEFVGIVSSGTEGPRWGYGSQYMGTGNDFRWTSAGLGSTVSSMWINDGAGSLWQRNYPGTPSAQQYHWTYSWTDASNYQGGVLKTSSTGIEIAAETAGSGADNLDITLTPAGTGKVVVDASHKLNVNAQLARYINDNTDGVTAMEVTPTTGEVKFASAPILLSTSSPASGAACTTGTVTWDASYIYVCTASGAWKRAALTGGY